jgi:hypothetical protein
MNIAGTEPTRKTTRHERGITLGIERFEEIVRVGPYLWSVPSCSGDHAYTVNLKGEGHCPCLDHTPEGEEDKHVVAARYKKAKTATCSGCRARLPHKALVDVPEGNYTFLEGELLCRPCARSHDAL